MTIIQSTRAAAIGLPLFMAAAAQAQVAVISLDNLSGYDPSVGDPLGDASRTDPLDGAVPVYAAKCLPDRAYNPEIQDKPAHCY